MTFATYFNPGVSLQGGSGSGSGTASLPITGNGATVTASTPLIDGTQTWNNAATTFTAFKINATDTASNAASLLMDLQVGGASVFFHRKSGAAYGPLGTAAAVSYGATANVGTGLFFPSATNLGFSVSGTSQFNISTTSLSAPSTSTFGFSAGAIGTAVDTILTRRAAANLRLGAADAAAPVAQTLSVQSVVAGTSNTAGANLTITGSQGTGTGAGGSIIFQVAPAGSSGTAQNALVDALIIQTGTRLKMRSGSVAGNAGSGLFSLDNTAIAFGQDAGGNVWGGITGSGFTVDAAAYYSFGSSGTASPDTILRRDAANTLALRNGANAQTFRVYNTTDGTNSEFGKIAWSSNVLQIGTEKAGTGTARALEFQTDGTTRLTLDTSGNVVVPIANNSSTLRLGGSSSGTTFQVDEDGSMQIRRLNSTSFGLSVGTRGGGAAPSLGVGASTLLAFASIDQPDGDSTYDVTIGRRTAGVMYLTGNATGASLEFGEMTAPAAPATDNVRIYADDNGSGKTRLMALFPTGAAVQIAIEP